MRVTAPGAATAISHRPCDRQPASRVHPEHPVLARRFANEDHGQDPDRSRTTMPIGRLTSAVSAGQTACAPCTASRRRTCWSRTHRRSSASSRDGAWGGRGGA
jgi:hypothetical protein